MGASGRDKKQKKREKIMRDDLKKYITQCLEQDLSASKTLYDERTREYVDALSDLKTPPLEVELKFKRAKLAKIHYAESLKYYRLWQNQKQLQT